MFIVDGAWPLFSDIFGRHNIYLKSPRIANELSGTCLMDKPSAIESEAATSGFGNRNRWNCGSIEMSVFRYFTEL